MDRLVIRKSDLAVLSGADQIQTIIDGPPAADSTGALFQTSVASVGRFAALTAFYNPATGKGTTERIFMDGEETVTAINPLNAVVGGLLPVVTTQQRDQLCVACVPQSSFENLWPMATGDTTGDGGFR